MSAQHSRVSKHVYGCLSVTPGCRMQLHALGGVQCLHYPFSKSILLGFDSDAVCKTRTKQKSCANLPAALNQLIGFSDECLKSKPRRYSVV